MSFAIQPAHIDEQRHPAETAQDYVTRMAWSKAYHIACQAPEAIVLGADTIVVLDEEVLGKPQDAAEARAMLRRLSGRQHTVLTGLAVVQQARQLRYQDTVSTTVLFHPLSDAAIEAYLATGEPFDKAGAYGIQGAGGALVASWQGCYTNVVGLPVQRTAALLRAAGMQVAGLRTGD